MPTNPLAHVDILFLDLSHTGWLNVSLSGARGKLNSRVDTVITLPNLALTHRLFSTQSYPHMPKNRRPQETSIEERRLSTHYELQKSVPPGRWEEEEPENWDRPFERGFFVQVGQKGQRPIDTDFAVRISKQSRIKLSTTVHEAHSQAHVNNVRPISPSESPFFGMLANFYHTPTLCRRLR